MRRLALPSRPAGAPPVRLPAPVARLTRAVGWRLGGIAAVGVKELRGRMRGRRAYAVLTVYLALLAGLAWMIYLLQERSAQSSFPGGGVTFAGAQIGQSIFIGLLIVETLQLVFLAPASTAGSISTEREKQTLDLLVATPIPPISIVLGKLFSALAYIVLLILASIPLTAMVFMFGGVGPEDVVRGYLVLLVTAIGLGSVGVFFSALVRRTQAATVLTYVTVLALTLGSTFVFIFWGVMTSWQPGGGQAVDQFGNPIRASGPLGLDRRPPEALLWFNPFVADVDVICGTESGTGGGACSLISTITGRSDVGGVQPVQPAQTGPAPAPMPAGKVLSPQVRGMVVTGGVIGSAAGGSGPVDVTSAVPAAVAPVVVQQPGPVRDTYWPRSSLAWLVISALLIWASTRLVSPTRMRRRPSLRRPWRRTPRGTAP